MGNQSTRTGAAAVVLLAALAFLGTAVFAAKEAPARRVIDPSIYKVLQYSFPYPQEPTQTTAAPRTDLRQQLGSAAPSASPGVGVGLTWYDYQHNGTMGRMNETRTGVATLAHFSWMFLPGRVIAESRAANYDNYNITDQAWGTEVTLQPNDEYAGYVNIDVTNDNRAVVGAHNKQPQDGRYDPTFYWDFSEGASFFGAVDSLPYAVATYASMDPTNPVGQEVIWPKFSFVEGASDTVLHVVAQVSLDDAGDAQGIYYFRRVGMDGDPNATWDNPPYVIDTIFDLSHAVEGTDDGKVALAWTANIKCAAGDADTASCNDGVAPVQWNNDIYYQISNDYGVSWQPRVNITKNFGVTGDHYQPYTDLGILIDSNGDLHVVWGGAFWNADGDIFFRDRIFHWSENQPYIRTAHSADYDQTTCNSGAWNLNASKMSISECNGRFYVLFAQFNDGKAGIFDDCADEGNPGFPSGAANGELYVVISEDGGLTWDQARNLTNSRTPGCDSAGGVGGPCESDHWPSMARFGTDVALGAGDNVTDVVVPTGGADNGWYLDVQYINDHSAGGIVQDEGTWQESDVRWFRLACVEAVTAPNPAWNPATVGFPAWTKAGRPYNRSIVIENLGNANYTYAVSEVENASVPAGITNWLSYTGFSGLVPFGINNTETGTLTVTPTGAVAGTIYNLTGALIFTGNNSTSPDTIPIDFIVADTLYPPELDTVTSACLSLVISNTGEMGDEGPGEVNMDFVNAGDCDPMAEIYMYSGSPVIGWISGVDTVGNWSVFGNSFVSPVGFFPISNSENYDTAGCDAYRSTFVTRDTSIKIEMTVFAPDAIADSCNFIIQRIKITSADGAAHAGLAIGEGIDWDVPSDSGSDNGSTFNTTDKTIWQYGGEYDQDDSTECQDDSLRYAGLQFLQMKKGATDLSATAPYGAYTADNPTWVYGNDHGFIASEIYSQMVTKSGFSVYESTNPDSLFTDLHMVMTFATNMSIGATDTLTIWCAKITVMQATANGNGFAASAAKAKKFWENHLKGGSDCIMRGDVNCDNKVIVSDLTYLVNFLFKGGPAPCLTKHGDVNCDNKTIVSDLTYLVNRLFKGGPAPCAC